MDMIVVDVTDILEAKPGSVATLIGKEQTFETTDGFLETLDRELKRRMA